MRLGAMVSLTGLASWLGVGLMGSGLVMQAKAIAAPILLKSAWQSSLREDRPVRPWSGLDAFPEARLRVPALNVDKIILDNASGQALAFAPGFVSSGTRISPAIAAHKNTHFGFLRHAVPGMTITLQYRGNKARSYAVRETRILDTRTEQLWGGDDPSQLVLITCYPFDAVSFRGPKRFVVIAEAINS